MVDKHGRGQTYPLAMFIRPGNHLVLNLANIPFSPYSVCRVEIRLADEMPTAVFKARFKEHGPAQGWHQIVLSPLKSEQNLLLRLFRESQTYATAFIQSFVCVSKTADGAEITWNWNRQAGRAMFELASHTGIGSANADRLLN